MKIEAGKYYRARDGRKPHSVTEGRAYGHMRGGMKHFDCKYGSGLHAETRCVYEGGTHIFGQSSYDLVEEIVTRVTSVGALRRAIAGHHKALTGAFVWDTSPQGDDYWRDRYHGRTQTTVADDAFLRSLLALNTPVPEFSTDAAIEKLDARMSAVEERLEGVDEDLEELFETKAGIPVTWPAPTRGFEPTWFIVDTPRIEPGHIHRVFTEAAPEPFKLRLGKKYVARNGDIVGPLRIRDHPTYSSQAERTKRALMDYTISPSVFSWTPDGSFYSFGHENKWDLVKEYVEPKAFKLEYGKKYLDREGKVVGPLTPTDRQGFEQWPFMDRKLYRTYRPDGSHGYHAGEILEGDLVKEYVERLKAPPPPVYTYAIQPGKRYKTRAGRITSEMKTYGPNEKIQHCDVGYYKRSGKWNGTSDFEAHDNDIVSEYVEPKPVAKAKKSLSGERVILDISAAEAETLMMALRRIAGDPKNSRRKHTDAINVALQGIGLKIEHEYTMRIMGGGAHFKDEPGKY